MISKLELIEDIDKVWHYSTMRVQYVAGLVLAVWVTLSADQQNAMLSAIGLPGDKVAAIGGALWLIANVTARVTSLNKNEPPAAQ